MSDIEKFIGEAAEIVNAELESLIPPLGKGPQSLRDAMRWSIFAGGKRFRPALVIAAGRAFDGDDGSLTRCGAAIELLHTYSLIHDDLPSMDDDDLRRGRETCHKKFGESTAILAGDALQALAFQTIASDKRLSSEIRTELISGLGRAAACMVVGQQMDLEAEGMPVSSASLEDIHRNKTGALIAFSVTAGAMIAEASESDVAAISKYGEKIGLLFQIVDDLLDITATTEQLGKTAGKDVAAAKATYPSVIGMDSTHERVRSAARESIVALEQISRPVPMLHGLVSYMIARTS
jgi:geranylgeranyl diphosphate synthase type II